MNIANLLNFIDSSQQALQNKVRFSAFMFFIFTFILSYIATTNLLELNFYQHVNIAFDLDQAWFIEAISKPSDTWLYNIAQEQTPLWIKHPLLYALRLPAEILQSLNISEQLSAIIVSLFFIALTPTLFFYCLRLCKFNLIQSNIFTLCFIFTSTFLTNMLVLDSYSIAQFWMLASIIIFLKDVESDILKATWLKAIIYVGLIGTTSYLLLFTLLCEGILCWKKSDKITVKALCRYLFALACKFSILFIGIFSVIYFDSLITLISDPVAVIQKTLWAVARPGEKEGIIRLIQTFLFFTLLSPEVSLINIEDNIIMLDYRAFDFSFVGILAAIILAAAYFLALCKLANPLIKLSVIWVIINLGFHLIYQDRGSLFLYTGHLLPILFLFVSHGLREFKKFTTHVALVLLCLFIIENSDGYSNVKNSLVINTSIIDLKES